MMATMFPNPANDFQRNFNALMQQNPDAAYNYALSSPDYQQLQTILPAGEYHQIVNQYSPGGTGYYLGNAQGNTFTVNGQAYQLPASVGSTAGSNLLAQIMAMPRGGTGAPVGSAQPSVAPPTNVGPMTSPGPAVNGGTGPGGEWTWADVARGIAAQNPLNQGGQTPTTPRVATDHTAAGGIFGTPAGPGIQPQASGPGFSGSIQSLLPGYGLGGDVGGIGHGFGIPGFENTPMVGGGSWAGTRFMPPGPSTIQQAPLPGTLGFNQDWTGQQAAGIAPTGGNLPGAAPQGLDPYYRNIELGPLDPGGSGKRANPGYTWQPLPQADPNAEVKYQQVPDTTGGGTSTVGGFKINRAVPYQTTWNLQTYSGKPAPYLNIHEQAGAAFQGIPTAYPGFAWAAPGALQQLGGLGGPPAGWTSMLGFNPGGTRSK